MCVEADPGALEAAQAAAEQSHRRSHHAEACLLNGGRGRNPSLFDRLNPVAGIVGSSHLTGAGLMTNLELNTFHQAVLGTPGINRQQVIELTRFLGQPLPGAHIRALRSGLEAYVAGRDAAGLVASVEALRQQAGISDDRDQPLPVVRWEEPHLICFSTTSGRNPTDVTAPERPPGAGVAT